MKQASKTTRAVIIFTILIITILALPFLTNPSTILNRNNDLRVFYSSFSFLKDSLVNKNNLPLWQNKILAGSPFLGDPQNPILYLPNYVMLFTSIYNTFLILFFFHFIISALGTYYIARLFRLSPLTSFVISFFFALSPKFITHLEEGHVNMLAAYAWSPFFFAFLIQTLRKPIFKTSLFLGATAAAIYLNYASVFIFCWLFGVLIAIWHFKRLFKSTTIIHIFISTLVFLAMSLPQIITSVPLITSSTRDLIVLSDIGPDIVSIKNLIKSLSIPYFYGIKNIKTANNIYFGTLPLLLSGIGFIKAKSKYKFAASTLAILTFFIVLGNRTKLFQILLTAVPFLMQLRITTRVWFVGILLASLLSGFAIDNFFKKKWMKLLILGFFIIDISFFTHQYFKINNSAYYINHNFVKLSKILQKETNSSRIYCITSCPIEIIPNNIGFASGYNPLQLTNYYYFIQQAAGYRFESYAPSLPPYQTLVDQPQPHANLMGDLGVKYIFSAYQLSDPYFDLIKSEDNQYLYENLLIKPTAYVKKTNTIIPLTIKKQLPGLLEVKTQNLEGQIIINEIYTPFWKARDQSGKNITIHPNNKTFLSFNLTKPSDSITIKYSPPFIHSLLIISFLTSSIVLLFALRIVYINLK